ncbi:MAG TPA: (deoxy)nucleoside triphosphate pyrophosphohydrolase [Actinomycetales bacterium]|nr:(deoxy)nucleoside triphosphate pyrophosphohydrolase [Actinomycetales bacterium]
MQLVVGAVLVDDLVLPSKVLAARRASPPALTGRWEFPGGKVEHGETPQGALRREIREELSVDVQLGTELVGPDDGCWPISERLTMRLWFARVVGVPRPEAAHDEVRWLTRAELEDVPWLPADVAVAQRLHDFLTG